MIIYSRKKRNIKAVVDKVEENKEIKLSLDNQTIPKKKKNKKSIPAPVVEETPVIEEEIQKSENEDLSRWLEEHMDD